MKKKNKTKKKKRKNSLENFPKINVYNKFSYFRHET